MTQFVLIDASVAVKCIIDEEHSGAARALLGHAAQRDVVIMGPPLLPLELVNAVYQVERRHGIPASQADRALAEFLSFPIRIVAPRDLPQRALTLARGNTHCPPTTTRTIWHYPGG